MKKGYNTIRFFFLMVGFVFCAGEASPQCTGTIITILGTGTAGNGSSGGSATSTAINVPWGVAADAAGNVYVCDFMNSKIRKVSPSGIVTNFAGTGTNGYSGNGGLATAAKIWAPTGIAVYGTDVYFVDLGNQRVRKVNAAGIISVVAGNGSSGYSGDGGQATAASISNPNGLCIDAVGNIYIPDQNTHRVRKVTTSGIISTIAGNGSSGSGGDGGAATAAQLGLPNGVTVDGLGNVFISDYDNNNIRKVSAATGIITTYAGTGTSGYSGDGGPATAAKVSGPSGMDVDNSGNLLICDTENNRIRKVTASTGIITTLAGSGSGYSGDGGVPDSAQFNRPHRINCDAGGNVYISDVDNHVIRKIINTAPAITGTMLICVGTTSTLTGPSSGGTWSSDNTARATINATTGVMAGISAGTVNITYQLPEGCVATIQATVNSAPTGNISGATNVCVGSSTTCTHPTPGGIWSSSNTAIATVGAATGVVVGISVGTVNITYTVGGCSKIKSIAVNASTGASIGGATTICEGHTTVLSYPAPGISWTSSNPSVATIGATSGVVSGISAGTTDITFLGTSGCGSNAVVTILQTPTAISGILAFCQGTTSTLASIGTTGGTWASSAPSRASVGVATGIVTGVRGGTANITYTWTNSCKRTAQVTVNPIPPAAAIVGAGTMSPTTAPTQTLAASTPGGTWASGNPAVATIVAGTGFMTAISAGTVGISYTQTNGCGTTINVRIFTILSPRPGAQLAGAGGSVAFSVYPNPTSGALAVEANTSGIFTVYAIDGRQVAQYAIKEAITPLTLPGGLASGLYMCRFNGDDGSVVIARLVYEQ